MNVQDNERQKIRAKYPGLAAKSSPRAAIHLFCIECMGGKGGAARDCETRDCFLWPHWLERARTR